MYYAKHPFLKVGLPFLSAMVVGMFLLVDMRKSRYESRINVRASDTPLSGEGKRSLRTLEEELAEWESVHRKRLTGDYEMKPVVKGQ